MSMDGRTISFLDGKEIKTGTIRDKVKVYTSGHSGVSNKDAYLVEIDDSNGEVKLVCPYDIKTIVTPRY